MSKLNKFLSFKPLFKQGTLNRFININNPSVWILFNELSVKTKGINLVSGFPNWDPPEFLTESIQNTLKKQDNSLHQITNSNGYPFFLETLAKHYSLKYLRKIDPFTEICVTPGANYAINHAILSLLNEGDELVSFEPFYPEYLPETYMAKGIFKGVPLIPPVSRTRQEYRAIFESKQEISFNNAKDEWKIDYELLKKSINNKTRVLLLNNPNNPTGKIFTLEELKEIAYILKDYPKVVIINDEVYEKVCFDEIEEIPRFSNLPNMWERSINILSAGKIFSATGIRVGWAIGPSNLIKPIIDINSKNIESIYIPIQKGVADAFIKSEDSYRGEKNYFEWSRKAFLQGRNRLLKSLTYSNMDFKFWTPQSGYFIVADFKNIGFDMKYFHFETKQRNSPDYAFALWLGNEKKTVGVPMSVFYTPENKHLSQNLIRFACCKTEDYFSNVDKNIN